MTDIERSGSILSYEKICNKYKIDESDLTPKAFHILSQHVSSLWTELIMDSNNTKRYNAVKEQGTSNVGVKDFKNCIAASSNLLTDGKIFDILDNCDSVIMTKYPELVTITKRPPPPKVKKQKDATEEESGREDMTENEGEDGKSSESEKSEEEKVKKTKKISKASNQKNQTKRQKK